MQLIINILYSSALLLCVALSFNIIYHTAKFFHISHAFTISFSAYMVYFTTNELSLDLPLSILISILIATFTGVLVGLIIYRPLRKIGASSMALMIASIGLYTILQNFLSICFGDDTKAIVYGDIKPGFLIGDSYITPVQLITIIVCVFVYVIYILLIGQSRIGRNIRAVSSSLELSEIFGINSGRTILWSFAIGSAIASIAGILTAFETGITTGMGFNILLYGMVAMIIGGAGSTWGMLWSSLFLAAIQQSAGYFIGTQWMDAIAYIILIFFLLWKPFGFNGRKLKKIEI